MHPVSSPRPCQGLDNTFPAGLKFARLNGRAAVDKRVTHMWQETDVQVLEYHPNLLPRWADAAPGKRNGCFTGKRIGSVKRTSTSSGSHREWQGALFQHRDAHDIAMWTIRLYVHVPTEKACAYSRYVGKIYPLWLMRYPTRYVSQLIVRGESNDTIDDRFPRS